MVQLQAFRSVLLQCNRHLQHSTTVEGNTLVLAEIFCRRTTPCSAKLLQVVDIDQYIGTLLVCKCLPLCTMAMSAQAAACWSLRAIIHV
jgi:hypothetical protein